MIKEFLVALVLSASFSVLAQDIVLDIDEAVTISCSDLTPTECPPTTVEYIKSYGKAHGGNHTLAATLPGAYAVCTACHYEGSTEGDIQNADYSFCPAREAVEFGNPDILNALGIRVPSMLGLQMPLADGTYFRDDILDQDIICGGALGCYARGEVPLCLDCHHHDGEPEGLNSRDVHNGCLDCHRRVGSSSLRDGIKNALEGVIED